MIKRAISGVLGVIAVVNGALMLLDGARLVRNDAECQRYRSF